MAKVATYLNFMGDTEEAFNFYKEVFGTDFLEMGGKKIHRIGDAPADPEHPLSDEDKSKVMNVQLPILGGHVIMGTDMLKSMGHELKIGNNITIELEPDTRNDTDKLYAALSEGGDAKQTNPPQDMFWGAYWGTCQDKFGIRWMFNCYEPREAK